MLPELPSSPLFPVARAEWDGSGWSAVAEHVDDTGGQAAAAVEVVVEEGSDEAREERRRLRDGELSRRHLHLDPGGYFLVRVHHDTALLEVAHHPCTVDAATGLVVDAAGKPVSAKGKLGEHPDGLRFTRDDWLTAHDSQGVECGAGH